MRKSVNKYRFNFIPIIFSWILILILSACSGAGFFDVDQRRPAQKYPTPIPDEQRLFLSGPTSASAGECTQMKVSLPYGYFAKPDLRTYLSSLEGASFFQDSNCSVPINSLMIPNDIRTQNFWIKQFRSGSVHIRVEAIDFEKTEHTLTIAPKPANQLQIKGNSNVLAGECIEYSVEATDLYGNLSTIVDGETQSIDLHSFFSSSSERPGSSNFYFDSACIVSTVSVEIPKGLSSAKVYHRAGGLGQVSLIALSSGMVRANLPVTVHATLPAKLELLGDSEVVSGKCTPYRVQLRDSMDNLARVGLSLRVSLEGAGTGGFFSDDACSSEEVSSLSIPVDNSSMGFYLRGKKVEALKLKAKSGSLKEASLEVKVRPSTPIALNLIGPVSLKDNACSAAYNIEVWDLNENPVPFLAPISINSSHSSVVLYKDASCSVPERSVTPIGSIAHFYIKSPVAATTSLVANHPDLSPASQSVTIHASAPSALSLSTPASTRSGDCSPAITVSLDQRAVTATPVWVTSTLGGTFHKDGLCMTSAVNRLQIETGFDSQIFYFKGTTAAVTEIRVQSPGLTGASSSITVVAGLGSTLSWNSGADTMTAGECISLSFSVLDASRNPTAVTAPTEFNLNTTGEAEFYGAPSCSSSISSLTLGSGDDRGNFFFRSRQAGKVSISIGAIGFNELTKIISVRAANPVGLAFNGVNAIRAGECAPFILYSQDTHGNQTALLSDAPVSFTNTGSGRFYADSSCKIPISSAVMISGSSSKLFHFRDTTSHTVHLRAMSAGFTAADLEVVLTSSAASKLVLTGPETGRASECIDFELIVQDEYSNPVNVYSDTSVSLDPSVGVFFEESECLTEMVSATIPQGYHSRALFFKHTRAEAVRLSASASGFSSATKELTLSAAAPAKLVLNGPAAIRVNTCTAYTVAVTDLYDNPTTVLSPTKVSVSENIFSDASCTARTGEITIPSGSGMVSAYYKAPSIGSARITVSAFGLAGSSKDIVVNAGEPSKIVLSGPNSATVGTCTAYTFNAQDNSSNNTAVETDTEITLSKSSANGGFFSENTCVSSVAKTVIPSGLGSAQFFFKNTKVEALTLSGNNLKLGSASISVNSKADFPSQLVLSGPDQLDQYRCSSQYLLIAKDAFGNDSPLVLTKNFQLSTTGRGEFHANADCTAPVTDTTIVGGNSSTVFYYKALAGGSATLKADDGPGDLAAAMFVVSVKSEPWGTNGVVVLPKVEDNNVAPGLSVLVRPDGRVNVVSRQAVIQYLSNGTLDNSFATNLFGSGGIRQMNNQLSGGTLQSDGKILAISNANVNNFILSRLTTAGEMDLGFGRGGIVENDINGRDYGYSVRHLADGKILAAGLVDAGGSKKCGLVRYNSNGSLDSAFGTGGMVKTPAPTGHKICIPVAIAEQSDGKYLLAGNITADSGGPQGMIIRYNANGSLDTSFDGDGFVIRGLNGADKFEDIIVSPDGKILAAGVFKPRGTNDHYWLAKFKSDGSVDDSFGAGGSLMVPAANPSRPATATGLGLQADGKIVLSGHENYDNPTTGNNTYAITVLRSNPNGTLDTGFGSSGKVIVDYNSGEDDFAYDITVQPDGKSIVTGETEVGSDPAIITIRLKPDGSFDK